MIEEIPEEFVLMMLGIFAGAIFITLVGFMLKKWRLRRMKNPHRDYFKK